MSVDICEKCGQANPSSRRCPHCGWWSIPLTEEEEKGSYSRCPECGRRNLFADHAGYMGTPRCGSCGWINWETIFLNLGAAILLLALAWLAREVRWLFWIFVVLAFIEGFRVVLKLLSLVVDRLGKTPFDRNPKQKR